MIKMNRELTTEDLSKELVLSKEDEQQANELANNLDLKDPNAILDYGKDVQNELSSFSQNMLTSVSNNEAGDMGKLLTDLMYKMKKANPQSMTKNGNWLMRLFGKANQSVFELRSRYQEIGSQIDKLSYELSEKSNQLANYNDHLSELYQANLDYYKKIRVLEKGLELKRNSLKAELVEYHSDRKEFEASEKFAKLQSLYTALDKKVYDLKLTEEVAIQQAPQIRVIQQTNQTLMEKVHSSLNTAVPLWKDQAFIAVALNKQKQVLMAQKWVTNTTNQMLTQNSQLIKSASIEAAKQNEEGFISVDTLKKTEDNLVKTITSTLQAQQEGQAKRKSAEKQLDELKSQVKQRINKMSRKQVN